MDVAWYERKDIQEKLIVFGRAVQGAYPYEVVIEADKTKCRSACCSYDARRITVNPTLFAVPAREQYLLTKALLVHEAGHRRYSTPTTLPSPVREIANILEDERIERRMCDEFMGVRWLIQRLTERFYQEAKPIDGTSYRPDQVVSHFLQLRWARRIGKPIKGELSPESQLLWKQVEPLVEEAWQAESSDIVNRNSRRIAEILGLGSNAQLTVNTNKKEDDEIKTPDTVFWRQTTDGR